MVLTVIGGLGSQRPAARKKEHDGQRCAHEAHEQTAN
jgi:hypothetical protein